MTRGVLLPLAGLLAVAGAFGLWLGLRLAPPSEGEIIAVQARVYVAETGGDELDCFGIPSGAEGVRLVVICEPEGGEAWFVAVDRMGRPVDPETLEEGPQT